MAEQKKSSAKAMILPPLVLAVICAVCCAFLALANMVTKDKIAAAEADAIQSSLQQLPDAGTFEEITDSETVNPSAIPSQFKYARQQKIKLSTWQNGDCSIVRSSRH